MGVSLIEVVIQKIVPGECLIIIQRVAAAHAYVLEEVVCLDQFGNGKEVLHSLAFAGGLFPNVVRLIEWRDAHHVKTQTLHVGNTCLDEFVPFFRLALIVGSASIVSYLLVVGIDRIVAIGIHLAEKGFVIAVQIHHCSACQFDQVAATFQFFLLTGSQGVGAVAIVSHEVNGLEGYTACGEVTLADMADAPVNIVTPVPGGIHAPVHFVFRSWVRDIE